MKKLKIIIALTLHSLLLPAQLEWAPIGAEWYYSSWEPFERFSHYYHYVSAKDTIVQDKEARVILGPSDTIIMHENNGRVYYLFRDKFRLIYDFTVAVGDTVEFEILVRSATTGEFDTTVVIKNRVDYIYRDDFYVLDSLPVFSTYSLDPVDYSYRAAYEYRERVGFITGFMFTFPRPQYMTHFIRCYIDSEIKYLSDWWAHTGDAEPLPCNYIETSSPTNSLTSLGVEVYPNPTQGHFQVSLHSSMVGSTSIMLYSLSGMLVLSISMDSDIESLDISGYPSGVYLLRLVNDYSPMFKTIRIIKY